MQARDVMTTDVVTVTPETPVEEVAKLLLARRISGVPVVDANGRLVGILTEGDLMRRPEIETERHRSWWLRLFADPRGAAEEYVRSRGIRADDVMTRQVVTVTEDTSLSEIAELLEGHRIKRVPVVRGGRVVGIVSRANLLHALVARREALAQALPADDRAIREQVLATLQAQAWRSHGALNVTVNDRMVELWGVVESEEERAALRVAVEAIPGVRGVKDHLGWIQPWLRGV